MQYRNQGEVTKESIDAVNTINRLIAIFNQFHSLNRASTLTGDVQTSGTLFLMGPRIKALLDNINIGNLLNVVPELEWLIVSAHASVGFKFDVYPEELTLPPLEESLVTNKVVIDLLSELLVTLVTNSREPKR